MGQKARSAENGQADAERAVGQRHGSREVTNTLTVHQRI